MWEQGLIDFVNVNELDASEANVAMLERMGFKPRGGGFVGGEAVAARFVERIRAAAPGLPINMCTTLTKDRAQLGAASLRVTRYVFSGVVRGDSTFIEEGRIKVRLGSRVLEV